MGLQELLIIENSGSIFFFFGMEQFSYGGTG